MIKLFDIWFVPFTLLDVIDILLAGYLIYRVHKLVRRNVAVQGLVVLVLVFVVWQLSRLANMVLLPVILSQVLQFGVIAAVVVFAPELRRLALDMAAQVKLFSSKKKQGEELPQQEMMKELIAAAVALSAARTGGIVVLMRNTDLAHIVNTGDQINASVSSRLLQSIFNTKSPLHDGAVLVENGQIIAARCVLPVSDDPDVPPELGLRHRSALGITEVSDAGCIVVSEETGKISVAERGRLKRNLSEEELRQFLLNFYARERE